MFERYALEAHQRISDYAYELYGEPDLNAATMGIPTFSSLPESEEYKHLPVKLYNKIQEFMDWVQWRQSEVSFRHEVEGRFRHKGVTTLRLCFFHKSEAVYKMRG